jgi:Na+:H+ antiporter, NhaC family
MDIFIAIIFSFILLIISSIKGIFIAYPLLISLCLFIVIAVRKGSEPLKVLYMAYSGGKKALVVLKIFVLIGAIISAWMSSGTVPAIVYYGIKFLNPKFFILSAFIISSIVSFLIGTSFGTVGTVGIALIVMARGSGVNIDMAAGAIMAGAYFGDRCSPMSSSASLIANLTGTDLYKNIGNMFKTSIIPLSISVIIYLLLSLYAPLNSQRSNLDLEIFKAFNVNIVVLIPAAVILFLSAFKIDVKTSMLISIIIAVILSVGVQQEKITDVIRYLLSGYSMEGDTPLKTIIKGGGIISMLKLAVVVFISSAFSGVFEGAGFLKGIDGYLSKFNLRNELLILTIIMSVATAAFGCTQTIAIILAHQIVKKAYEEKNVDNYQLAVDIENTAVVISPLIPWNIAGLIPAATLMVGPGYILYSFYLYLIPITNFIYLKLVSGREKTQSLG